MKNMTGKYKKYNGMTRKDLIDSVILWTEIYDKSFNNYISLSKRHDDLKDKYTEVTAQEAMDNMNDACMKHKYIDKINFACNIADELANGKQWIDLDIDNLPEFIKKDVDVQKYIDGNWVIMIKSLKSSIAYDIAEPTISSKYRYRLKPLEYMTMTKKAFEELAQTNIGDNRECNWDGREVKIID